MRHIFIINPTSGKRDVSELLKAEIEAVCRKYAIEPLIFISEYKYYERDMTEKMCALFSNEEIRFYSVGGSGTLTNIISGIKNFETTEVACCAYGLTNDLLKCYTERDSFRSIEKLITGRTDRLDIIESAGVNSVIFTTLGLGTKYWNDITFFQLLSHVNTALPYWMNVIWEVITNKSYAYNINVDGHEFIGRFIMLNVFNGCCMGGNLRPLCYPRPNDGVLDVLLMDEMSLPTELRLLGPYSKGQLDKLGHYIHVMKAKKVVVQRMDRSNISLNCDGECFVAGTQRITIEIKPGKLKFVVPQDCCIIPPELDM